MAGEDQAEGHALIAAVRADPLLAPYADALEAHARPSIRLRPIRGGERYPGESRVGGRPAVPVGFQWPKRHVDMPPPSPAWLASNQLGSRLLPPDGMSAFEFIAQIDLAAVARYDAEGFLPGDGTLLFFYDGSYISDIEGDSSLKPTAGSTHNGMPMHFYGADQVDQVRVIHVPGGTTLRLSDDGPHAPYAMQLQASQDRTLPNVDVAFIAKSTDSLDDTAGQVVLPPDAWTQLAALDYEHRMNRNINQMLGWADCGSHGPSLDPDLGYPWKIGRAEFLRATREARMLLQLSPETYEPTGIRIGRRLYFNIRESDLRRADFSRVWFDFD